MARGKPNREELKKAISTLLLVDKGVNEIARELGVAKSTVSAIKKELEASHGDGDSERSEQFEHPEFNPRDAEIDAAVGEYLLTTIRALTTQAKLAGDESYLRKYPPQQLALLHGTMADKAARILEAASSVAGGREEGESATSGEGTGLPGSRAGGGPGVTVRYVEDNSTTAASRGAAADQAGGQTL